MSIKLGPGAESVVKICWYQMRPVALIDAWTRGGFELNSSVESCFVNGVPL